MTPQAAEKLSLLMIRINALVDQSVLFVQELEPADLDWYRRSASRVMMAAFEIASTLYVAHPELKPKELGGPYDVDRASLDVSFYPST